VLRLDTSTGHCYLEIQGRAVPIEDPFDPEHGTLRWPRREQDSAWSPFGAAPRGEEWLVFFYNFERIQLVEWVVNHEGRFQGQRPITSADLIEFVPHLYLLAERLFFGLMVQFPEAGRAAALRSLRWRIGDRHLAQRFLYGYYQSLGRPEMARRHVRRLGDEQGSHQPPPSPSLLDPGVPPRVLYLIQSARRLPEEMEQGFASAGAHFHCLTFREQVVDSRYAFAPGSTWTSGRNLLLRRTRPDLEQFDYVVLMDDDVRFEQISFGEGLIRFREFLAESQPEIGVVATPWHQGFGHYFDAEQPFTPVAGFDALFNAYRRDVILDGILFPYIECFDHSSWWSSQLVLMKLAARYYTAIQCNGIAAKSLNSSPYPRGCTGDISVTCLLKLFCGPTASIEELGAHAFEHFDGSNPLHSSLQKRMLRYITFNPELRDRVFQQPVEAI
jgi:hypothetical protein